jgi:hypothetical protein
MAVAIEDAGFEIRDQIMWVYGSGFPKSHDVSKAIDKNNGETGRLLKFTNWMRTTGLKAKQLDEATGTNMGGHYLTTASQPAIPTVELWQKIRPLVADVPEWVDELVDRIEAERKVVGKYETDMGGLGGERLGEAGGNITAPATAAAKQWDGWGTALKPAHEPMVLARKPLEGTVANNVLTFGTGGLNIDATRVEGLSEKELNWTPQRQSANPNIDLGGMRAGQEQSMFNPQGRFPANFIHDGSDEVVALFPANAGGGFGKRGASTSIYGGGKGFTAATGEEVGFGDSGSAARFFYCAKASKRDRNEGLDGFEAKRDHDGRKDGGVGGDNPRNRTNNAKLNHHPTVKPTSLMQYLIRLVTPPNGIVLDPFMGSGSTGKACAYEGFEFIGIDQSAEYVEIAQARIDFALADKSDELPL